jgi:hypothetical protein
MKIKLLMLLIFIGTYNGFSQTPTIQGDLLLCPNTNGTAFITTDQVYDSYTWYFKYWFVEDPFEAIPGAEDPSFTYDWNTYDQALLKVVVTLDGNTYESNTIQIDSYAWLPITTGFENVPNVSIGDNGDVLLCEGTGFVLNVYNPYTIVQWYKDGQPIPGADEMQLHINEPGSYYAVAAPAFCPLSSATSLPTVVLIDTNCELGIDDPDANRKLSLYPNPVRDVLHFSGSQKPEAVAIYNMAGQAVFTGKLSGAQTMSVSSLPSGIYIVKAISNGTSVISKFVKE